MNLGNTANHEPGNCAAVRRKLGENPPGRYFHHMKEVTGTSQQGFTKGKFFLTNLIIPFKMLHGL